MRILSLAILILLMLSSCNKHNDDPQNSYIRGRLFLTDTITNLAVDSPLAKKIVVLAEDNGDMLNYLYSDTTDNEGYFVFNLLNNDISNFVVRYEENIKGIVLSINVYFRDTQSASHIVPAKIPCFSTARHTP